MAGVPTPDPAAAAAADPAPPADPAPESDNKTTAAAAAAAAAPASDQPAAGQKKERKQRRQGLPLPDPIPETPVKRYPEPSKDELQAKVDAEDAKLQVCFDKLNSTRAFYDQRQKIREDGRPAFEAARKVFAELNDQCRVLFEERKSITAKLKAIKDADIAARGASNANASELVGAGKDGNEALRNVRTMEELDARIEELNFRLETESMPILEEKQIVARISFLTHKGRDFIRGKDQTYKDEKAAKEARMTSRKELEESRKELDTRIDAAKAKLETQKKVVDDVRAKQDAEVKKLQDSTSFIDRDEEKKKITEIKAIIRKLRDDYHAELDKWYLNERIHYEQQKIAKRKKYEAMQAEREARRKAWEEEQAQYPEPHPYQEEKDMCSGLTVYMQTLLGETVDKPTVNLRGTEAGSAPSLKPTANTREITASGKKIGKNTTSDDGGFGDLAFSDFVKKSSKSKNKKGRRSAAAATTSESSTVDDAVLKPHSIDYLAAFTKLGIKPPNKLSEVRVALEAVKARAAFYETAPAPSAEEKAKKAESKQKKQPSEKKASNGVDLMNGDGSAAAFPGLHSEGTAPVKSRDASMPSFSAVASGVATAPAPAPTMPSDVTMMSEMNNGQVVIGEGLGTDPMAADAAGEDGAMVPTQPEPSMAEA